MIRFRLKRLITLATVNVRGHRQGMAVTEVEQWMTRTNTEMAGIQETKTAANENKTNEQYTWFYSGNSDKRKTRQHTVGALVQM